ncbi:UNKNOWN [Stylonychia lemnae]|uniref:Rna-binding protein 25 n=1 Tax=Stylonychia lemnae TaxID=5949 RepID=A0A077ZW86_STYLE|nr:UNKNOWN [Stylonychia lemnae]|eukprot:CDW73846.1 UNKNOWN [Stylonychia lemnae]
MSGPAPINATSNIVASSQYSLNPIGMLATQNISSNKHVGDTVQGSFIQQNPNSTILLNPPPTQRSVAEDLLKPTNTINIEENRKLYIGKIPKNVSDDFLERLFRCCGQLLSWKRSTDANGEPKAFGFVEYENIESVFACLKIINNLPLLESRLMVKANDKTNQFLNDWKELKKMDWISQQEKAGNTIDNEDLEYKEQLGELMPYEQELIPSYDDVIIEINKTIENKDIIEQVALQQKQNDTNPLAKANLFDSDPFSKYKEHEREQRRERRAKNIEKEREAKFLKKVEEWLLREVNREKEKEREAEREKEKLKERQKLIELDLNYDSGEEKKRRKKNPKEYQRYLEERKRIRDKEQEDDEADRKKEAEEMIELEKKRAEERRKQEEQRKREEEIRERLKLKRFMELEEQERQRQNEEDNLKRQKIHDQAASEHQSGRAQMLQNQMGGQQNQNQQQYQDNYSYQQQQMDKYSLQRFGDQTRQNALGNAEEYKADYENYQMKKHKPLAKLSENIVQNIRNIESEVRSKGSRHDRDGERSRREQKVNLKEYLEDDEKKKILEKTKELYAKLPKTKEDIFKFQLNWNNLFMHDVIEKVGRPWIGKKVKEYMGVEEQAVVQLIIKILNQKPDHIGLQSKLKDILDQKTEEFVMKLWQTMAFECMKVDEGLYKMN